jgi:hypothetical protein
MLLSGSKTGSAVVTVRGAIFSLELIFPTAQRTAAAIDCTTGECRLTQTSYNFAGGCKLAFGRAHDDFDAAIGTLLFD